MMTEQNNYSNEFDIFEVLKQHIKNKKNSSTLERNLCKIETNFKKDMELINANLSSAELKQNVVEHIQKQIECLERRHIIYNNAKKPLSCIIVTVVMLIAYIAFKEQVFDFLINILGLSGNKALNTVNNRLGEILLGLCLLIAIFNSKLIDILAEGIVFIWDKDSVPTLEGLEECISLLEMQKDIAWTLENPSQSDDL